jgi:Uma2 family endonuclease
VDNGEESRPPFGVEERAMPVSEQTFKQLAWEDPEGHWELDCGRPRQKPAMTAAHNRTATYLGAMLIAQLDPAEFEVRVNSGHVRRSETRYYIPDVLVLPRELVRPFDTRVDLLETYADPLPLVVEVWSPSTGGYDVDDKLPEYQRRGDREIWRIHPFERTLIVWRREADGAYSETLLTAGSVQPVALPGVSIELARIFQIV